MPRQPGELVITGLGVVTASGLGVAQTLLATLTPSSDAASRPPPDRSLAAFRPHLHLTEKKMVKFLSHAGAIGLAAIEDLRRSCADLAVRPQTGDQADRLGLYVSAPAPYHSDRSNYKQALLQACPDGSELSLSRFAESAIDLPPMSGLLGLPNGVACYGSIILSAKGANSTYTSLDTGAHQALLRAAHHLRRGRLDLAVVGGYASPNEAAAKAMYTEHIVAAGEDASSLADGACFVALRRRDAADTPLVGLATLCGGAVGSDAGGSLGGQRRFEPLTDMMARALANAGITPRDVGLVFCGAPTGGQSAELERQALAALFGASVAETSAARPVVLASQWLWGNLVEAGGLLEIAAAQHLYDHPAQIPDLVARTGPRVWGSDAFSGAELRGRERPYCMITRLSPFGDCSCIVIKPAVPGHPLLRQPC
jgi:hypothetical protein